MLGGLDEESCSSNGSGFKPPISPQTFCEDDTMYGVFIGPFTENEEAPRRSLHHALSRDDDTHDSQEMPPNALGLSPNPVEATGASDTLTDEDGAASDASSRDLDGPEPGEDSDSAMYIIPVRSLRPRKRVTLSPMKSRRIRVKLPARSSLPHFTACSSIHSTPSTPARSNYTHPPEVLPNSDTTYPQPLGIVSSGPIVSTDDPFGEHDRRSIPPLIEKCTIEIPLSSTLLDSGTGAGLSSTSGVSGSLNHQGQGGRVVSESASAMHPMMCNNGLLVQEQCVTSSFPDCENKHTIDLEATLEGVPPNSALCEGLPPNEEVDGNDLSNVDEGTLDATMRPEGQPLQEKPDEALELPASKKACKPQQTSPATGWLSTPIPLEDVSMPPRKPLFNPFLVSVSPVRSPRKPNVPTPSHPRPVQISNPFLPATPVSHGPTSTRGSSLTLSMVPQPSPHISGNSIPSRSKRRLESEPESCSYNGSHVCKKLKPNQSYASSQAPDPSLEPTVHGSPPDTLTLALMQFDAKRRAEGSKTHRASLSDSPVRSMPATSNVRAVLSSPRRNSDKASSIPTLESTKAGRRFKGISPSRLVRTGVRPNPLYFASPEISRATAPPTATSSTQSTLQCVKSSSKNPTACFPPSSPDRGLSIPSSPSPNRRAKPQLPIISPSKPLRFSGLQSSLTRSKDTMLLSSDPRTNENHHEDRMLISMPENPRKPVITRLASPRRQIRPTARPSGIPMPRYTFESRLPRVRSTSKLHSSKGFPRNTSESRSTPTPTMNVFTAHAVSAAEHPKDNNADSEKWVSDEPRSPLRSKSQQDPSIGEASHSIYAGMEQMDVDPSPEPITDRSSSVDPLNMSPVSNSPRRFSRRLSGQSAMSASDAEAVKPLRKCKPGPSSQGRDRRNIHTISPAALRDLTTRNTRKNDGYNFSVLNTRVLFKEGPRPPSPASKIRTVQTEAAEQARNARARKRELIRGGTINGSDCLSSNSAITPETPRPAKHPRAPGDDDDYHTPKKFKLAVGNDAIMSEPDDGDGRRGTPCERDESSEGTVPDHQKRKFVRWDTLLANDAETPRPLSMESRRPEGQYRGALKTSRIPELDGFGNKLDTAQPLQSVLKKERITVLKVVYENDDELLAQPIVKKALKAVKGGPSP
ncbi:uncharacterized protein EI90DRAFT_3118551 [Cantharellus anzutake]|uniref:uncharacterized protein n=1 Tax=Cantharellus anzutake TaxID=1750568 RepID=UPI001905519F|nr:uncharacterized protein EI90DRAFT_3118551 [Cantharellus anzutake]KAF8338101.1 hypothetical protein EI90DRAFT_3118551 [Cantharellus anzutake]